MYGKLRRSKVAGFHAIDKTSTSTSPASLCGLRLDPQTIVEHLPAEGGTCYKCGQVLRRRAAAMWWKRIDPRGLMVEEERKFLAKAMAQFPTSDHDTQG